MHYFIDVFLCLVVNDHTWGTRSSCLDDVDSLPDSMLRPRGSVVALVIVNILIDLSGQVGFGRSTLSFYYLVGSVAELPPRRTSN